MTGEQKKWLDEHRIQGYRPVGQTSATGSSGWTNKGILHADGTFEPFVKTPRRITAGCFEVGIYQPPANPGGFHQ